MATRIDDLFEELKAYADDTIKQANALEGIDSMPGSENDKPIPSGAENPDPKVKDETIDRPAKDTLDGAKKDGDIPASNVNKMEADQPVLTPDKKPLDTADANAKEASVKGNNLVQLILKTKQAAAAKEAAAKNPAAPVQAAAPAAPATKEAAPADADTIKLDMAMMAKIAAITLADEEGQLAVQAALTKRAGAEFAEEVLDILEKRAAEEQARAEFEKGAQDAEAMIGDMQEAQGAADAEAAMGDLQEAQGAADAEAAMAGAAGDEAGAEEDAEASLDDYSAEDIVKAVNELAEEGQIPPEQAQAVIEAVSQGAEGEGSPEDISEDDLAEAIVQAVESGDMTEEDAQALVQAISEGGGDPEADQALAADVAGAAGGEGGAAPAAGEGGEGEAEKAAAAKAEAEKQAAAEKRASFKAQLVSVLKGKK